MTQAQDGDDGIFQFGSSVSFNDEMRRSTMAETEEIEKSRAKLSEGINLEQKLRDQATKDRSHATKEMDSHLRSRKEATDRLSMNDEVLQGLFHTLRTELSSDFYSQSGSSASCDSTIFDTSSDGGSNTTSSQADDKSIRAMKRNSKETESRVNALRLQMRDIKKSLATQVDAMKKLDAEAAKVETSVAGEGLEAALEKSRGSTASKRQMLEDVKRRQGILRSNLTEAEQRFNKVEKEIADLCEELASKQKDTASKLADGEKVRYSQMQEEGRLEEILRQIQIHDQSVLKEIQVLKKKDSELAAFIAKKEEKVKRREELRAKRNRLYALKKEREKEIVEVKTRVDRQKRSLASNEKEMEGIQKIKLRNDKREAEVTLRAKSELEDVLGEKKASEAALAEASKPAERKSFANEMLRLAELRGRREIRRKDLEERQVALQQRNQTKIEQVKESKIDLEALRKMAKDTADLLKGEQSRMDRLVARRAKRDEAFRKLQVIRYGGSVLEMSREMERKLIAPMS